MGTHPIFESDFDCLTEKMFKWLISIDIKDQTLEKPELIKYLLPEEKQYMDWWKITPDNFDQRIMNSVDTWIIAIHRKHQLPVVWKNEAVKYRGTMFFGKLLEENLNDELKSRFKYTDKPKLIAYKWTRAAKAEFLETDDMIKALEYVITSMPTKHINQVTFGANDQSETHLNQFILRSFYQNDGKPRFPLLFVYDPAKGGVPAILRVMSHYFKEYFNFGLVDKKDIPEFQAAFSSYPKPRAEQLPQLVALIGEEPSDEAFTSGDANLSFRIVVMVKEKFGKMDFSNFVGYLFWLNNEFREKIPAKPDKEDILIETMGSVRNSLWKRLEAMAPGVMQKSQNEGESRLGKDSSEAFKKLRAQAEANVKKAKAELKAALDKKDEL